MHYTKGRKKNRQVSNLKEHLLSIKMTLIFQIYNIINIFKSILKRSGVINMSSNAVATRHLCEDRVLRVSLAQTGCTGRKC